MINVIGLGYIGLPTALMLASKGLKVVGTDYNSDLIHKLSTGSVTFEEPGLKELYQTAINQQIEFSSDYHKTDLYLVAVPTPYDAFSKKIDVSYILKSVESILNICEKGSIIIIESTISPGTTDAHIKPLVAKAGYDFGKDISIVHAPERIIPGNMINELRHNSRTVGSDDPTVGERIADIYRLITDGEVIVTDIKTAEMTKVVENTYRAVNIAFANEMAKICRHANMDVYEVIKISNMHPRVNILNPGPGVGGHCIPVDPWFLVGDYPSLTNVIWEALKVNASMPEYVLSRAKDIMSLCGIDSSERVGIYGLTYKENVDDFRESPSLQLINKQLESLGSPLKSYDPWIANAIVKNQYHSLDDFLADVDMVIIMVKHDEIIRNSHKLKGKIIFDTQNVIKSDGVFKL